MGLNYVELSQEIRELMLDEVNLDLTTNSLYLSKRLTAQGWNDYPTLLKKAVQFHNDDWLAHQLSQQQRIRLMITTKTGPRHIPSNAHVTLAEGEFNRFYMRGICQYAIKAGIEAVTVYRAKAVYDARFQSQKLIGRSFDPNQLLEDLRLYSTQNTKLGISGEPNSGISIKLG